MRAQPPAVRSRGAGGGRAFERARYNVEVVDLARFDSPEAAPHGVLRKKRRATRSLPLARW